MKATFQSGVHPDDAKELTAASPIRRLPFPDEVVLPLQQHTGAPATLMVRVGDHVERGDMIAKAEGFISSSIHASAAGKVVAIGPWPHPSGRYQTAVRIAVDRYAAQTPRRRLVPHWEELSREEIVAAVQQAGVVGLGGAAFPAHVKLSPPADQEIDTLLVNGCECEPYLTSDHRVMVEYSERVYLGIRIMLHCLGIQRAVIGIERNKPDAIETMRAAVPEDLDVEVCDVEAKYPQGAEKMLIKALLDREVPSGGLPGMVGVVVQNVGSVATLAEVFETGLPLIERIVTVTGLGVREPGNWIVPVGTRLRDLLAGSGGLADNASEIIFGGPMMGIAISNLDTPVLKGTSGVLVLSEGETPSKENYPCIRCGHCLDACPVFLNPQRLGNLAASERWSEMLEVHLMDCMLCGCCSYVCPSNIPLTQLFAMAKAALRRRPAA
ncbi:MAG: electron transport complex subunit RsxC [Deltaproteobacteria bacterium]|nr:electron transport complex subunit RsxC [Deltaproteobacteria bacterium]MBW2386985.1 electron transport complex subunit RsxC [Deltaproteobacteria bacterium]MBW2722920.1 electron transport complex subunit RsxC [Deltaproteobacteria bacterium]